MERLLRRRRSLMTKRTRLPLIVFGRSMSGGAPTEEDPKIKFELEAETGEDLRDRLFCSRNLEHTYDGQPLVRVAGRACSTGAADQGLVGPLVDVMAIIAGLDFTDPPHPDAPRNTA